MGIDVFAEHGRQALLDGGLQLLIELVATRYACVAADAVFKLCAQSLVRDLGASSSGTG